jgi:hypothetical protein
MPLFCRLRRRRIDRERPFNLSTQDTWSERADAAVKLWERHAEPGHQTVADLGAGNRRVHRLLTHPSTTYIAYDLLPQTDLVHRLDVREGLPALRVDATFMLGLIEYIEPRDPIIERLSAFTTDVVASYVAFDETRVSQADRVRLSWVRHETKAATEARFAAAGFRCVDEASVDGGLTTLWLWRQGS